MRFMIKQNKNYEIDNCPNINIALVTENLS